MNKPTVEPFRGGYRIRIGIDVLGFKDTLEEVEIFLDAALTKL